MVEAIRIIAERRISEAISEGRLQVEGWHGKPLPAEENPLVPADLRMAYKILKNAGYVPEEISARREIARLEELIARTEDEHLRLQQIRKLNVLVSKLNMQRHRPLQLEEHDDYFRRIVERVPVASANDHGGRKDTTEPV